MLKGERFIVEVKSFLKVISVRIYIATEQVLS